VSDDGETSPRSTIRVAAPLPECEMPGCEQPVRRQVWEANGHLCTACSRGIADTVRMVPVRGADVVDLDELRRRRLDRHEQLELTTFVERWLPPVPGQPAPPAQDPSCQWAHGGVSEVDSRGLCAVCAEDTP